MRLIGLSASRKNSNMRFENPASAGFSLRKCYCENMVWGGRIYIQKELTHKTLKLLRLCGIIMVVMKNADTKCSSEGS